VLTQNIFGEMDSILFNCVDTEWRDGYYYLIVDNKNKIEADFNINTKPQIKHKQE
jgi:hypothetical protein